MSKRDQFKYRQIAEFNEGRLSRLETARLLRLSERSVSRLAKAVADNGFLGVRHGNRERVPGNKIDPARKKKVLRLVAKRYYDFNMLHCLEVLKSRHRIEVARETFRRWCHEKQLVKRKKRRRSKPRHYRSRMPAEGYLLQMDGSPHRYNGKDVWSLILAIDDATSKIPHAQFFAAETTSACMQVLKEIILKCGLPRALYVDKAGWAGGGKRIEFTQFHRACDELGIQILFANSPEAKGRVERAFDTFQDRVIPELRLKKIKSMARANLYLARDFLPKYWNARNIVEARQPITEYRALSDIRILDEILCHKQRRAVDPAGRISLRSDHYQLKHPRGLSLARKRVEVRHYEDRPMAIYFENVKLRHHKLEPPRRPNETFSLGN